MIDLSSDKANELVSIGKVTNSIWPHLDAIPAAPGGAGGTDSDYEKKRRAAEMEARFEFNLLRRLAAQ